MLSNNLKKLRKEKGLTLEVLAEMLGTSKQTIHRYESGKIQNVPPEKVEQLAAALGVTPSELMGWSQKDYADVRGIMPIKTKRLSILGDIACGNPIFTNEEYEGFVTVDDTLDADFCLRAHGDSMIGARIYDGDIVFIHAQEEVTNGEIAAIIIGDEATLKRVYYYPEKEKLVLSPENPRYEPLVFVKSEIADVKIIGKAVAFQSRVI